MSIERGLIWNINTYSVLHKGEVLFFFIMGTFGMVINYFEVKVDVQNGTLGFLYKIKNENQIN